jgi:hypothetical protein
MSEGKAKRVARARSAPASAKRAKRKGERIGVEPMTSGLQTHPDTRRRLTSTEQARVVESVSPSSTNVSRHHPTAVRSHRARTHAARTGNGWGVPMLFRRDQLAQVPRHGECALVLKPESRYDDGQTIRGPMVPAAQDDELHALRRGASGVCGHRVRCSSRRLQVTGRSASGHSAPKPSDERIKAGRDPSQRRCE